MTVRIEIQADNGSDAAAELKRLADGLAIMGLLQQRAIAVPVASQKKPEFYVSMPGSPASEAEVAGPSPEVQSAPVVAEPVAEPKKRGRKSKAEKEAEAAAAETVTTVGDGTAPATEQIEQLQEAVAEAAATEEAPAENPNPYRLFDENGAEEELFDTADAYKMALTSMFNDAPDSMTCKAVGKSNEETMRRIYEEEGDEGIATVTAAYKAKMVEFEKADKAKKAAEAAAEPKTEEAAAPAAATATGAQPQAGSIGATATIDEVRDAMKKLAAAKGIPATVETLKKFGASKAGEVPEARRAEFVAACEAAAKPELL